MSVATTSKPAEMPLVHAGMALALLIGCLSGGAHFVPLLGTWPYYLLAPLVAYAVVVTVIGPLRRSLTWTRLGRLDSRAWTATAGVIALSVTALVVWHTLAQPDVSAIVAQLPQGTLLQLCLIGAMFSCLNAFLEEVLFRGLLFDALRVSYGVVAALVIQAVVFGVFHYHGFPNGVIGVAMASVYGLMQGWLRVYSGGLAVCWVAHVFADATIFTLLLGDAHS